MHKILQDLDFIRTPMFNDICYVKDNLVIQHRGSDLLFYFTEVKGIYNLKYKIPYINGLTDSSIIVNTITQIYREAKLKRILK